MIEVRHDGEGDCAGDGEKAQDWARARFQDALQEEKQQDADDAAQRIIDRVHKVAGADFQDILHNLESKTGRTAQKRLRPRPFVRGQQHEKQPQRHEHADVQKRFRAIEIQVPRNSARKIGNTEANQLLKVQTALKQNQPHHGQHIHRKRSDSRNFMNLSHAFFLPYSLRQRAIISSMVPLRSSHRRRSVFSKSSFRPLFIQSISRPKA